MQILVLNGSPKGSRSITLQTIHYLELRFPEDRFTVVHVSSTIRALEKDPASLIEQMQNAELVVFCYPVYSFMAPSQLHRFLALLKEKGVRFDGVPMTQLTTSKHFYDVTAHRFLEDNCKDLGFTVLPGLSADMEDLPKESGQKQAYDFWTHLHWCLEGRPSLTTSRPYTVNLITDATADDTELNALIQAFQNNAPFSVRLLNLNDFPFQGGCLGCLKCAATGNCVYTDGFETYLRDTVQKADALVYAFTVRDHSMGALFKQFDDRQFCNGHRTVTMGQPVGYLVHGDLSTEENLRMVLQARAQVGGNYLAGIVSSGQETTLLQQEILFALEQHYVPPTNFLGIGGMRIFRDLIYQMQGLMKQDHKFFKAHGQYDFPQKKPGTILAMYLVGILFSNPKLMKKMGSKIDEGMMAPYRKVLEKYRKQS